MDIIKNYLETIFMNLPNSKEVARAKEELLSMMEDKYNELKAEGRTENEAIGIVISEFGNLDELAAELGIDDFVKRKEDVVPDGHYIKFKEVKEYIDTTIQHSREIGVGVMLCVCSPIVLILLSGITEATGGIGENMASAIGVVTLLIMVAIAVGIFIYSGMRMENYNYLKNEKFYLENNAQEFVKGEKGKFHMRFTQFICTGVILCVLSVVPVIFTGSLFGENEILSAASVGILLSMVSVAVLLFVTAGVRMGAYKLLLQEKEYMEREMESKLAGAVAGIYWPLIVCIYLIWSFTTKNWGITWAVFPIAGIIFGAIAQICNMIEKSKSEKQI